MATAVVAASGCGKSNKAGDVAQDSILVKDADLGARKTDTAAANTATLVRDRGSVADAPSLTTGAPVKRAPSTSVMTSQTGLQPPTRINPSPVLPARESTVASPTAGTPPTPRPTAPPTPVTQPVSPQPAAVLQPPPPATPPKTDSLYRF